MRPHRRQGKSANGVRRACGQFFEARIDAFHVAEAIKRGVSDEEVAEALGVAINLNAGAAMTDSTHVLDARDKLKQD